MGGHKEGLAAELAWPMVQPAYNSAVPLLGQLQLGKAPKHGSPNALTSLQVAHADVRVLGGLPCTVAGVCLGFRVQPNP